LSSPLALTGRLVLAVCAVAALSGCEPAQEGEGEAAAQAEGDGNAIECAVAGAAYFEPVCAVERVELEDGSLSLVVWHPDGGFRRFSVLTDGRGLAVADGAEQAMIELVDGRLDVSVGSDRYRFPATVRANAESD
jgi:hypothetical protein